MFQDIQYLGSEELDIASEEFLKLGGDKTAFMRGWMANHNRCTDLQARFNNGRHGTLKRHSWVEGWNAYDRYIDSKVIYHSELIAC